MLAYIKIIFFVIFVLLLFVTINISNPVKQCYYAKFKSRFQCNLATIWQLSYGAKNIKRVIVLISPLNRNENGWFCFSATDLRLRPVVEEYLIYISVDYHKTIVKYLDNTKYPITLRGNIHEPIHSCILVYSLC